MVKYKLVKTLLYESEEGAVEGEFVKSEYEKFKPIQDKLFQSDYEKFDEESRELLTTLKNKN